MLIWDKQYGVIPGQVNHFTPAQLRMSTQTHIQNEVKIGADSDNGALFASWQCSFFTKGANSSIKVIWGQHYPLLSNWPAPYNTTTAWSQLKWHFHPLMTNCLLLWRRGGGGGSDLCSREEGFGNNHLKHWYTLATNSRLKGIKNDKEDKQKPEQIKYMPYLFYHWKMDEVFLFSVRPRPAAPQRPKDRVRLNQMKV